MDFKIAALSLDIVPGDIETNLREAGHLLHLLPADTDVAVLPELFSTGFFTDRDDLLNHAETTTGKAITAIRRWAAELNIAIAGSFLALNAGSVSNRGFFIEPSGEEAFYDKRHLFCGSPEADNLRPGTLRAPIVRFRGWNISMVICYDIRFPVWCRNVGQLYDILLVPANWPHAREYAWKHLLIGRAIENQAYIVGANRSGEDSFGNYDNLSYIIDPLGQEIGQALPVNTRIITATFSKDTLEKIRHKLPVGRDAENFNICDL